MFLQPESDLAWFPTHVQITVLQAKALRAKGKHGTSDAYTLIQIGREKYSTSVVEKSPGSPEWKEECSFELAPGALERGESCDLQLTVMHRALIGMDQFLGQVSIPLHQLYREGRSQRNQWYKLSSKPGKKEKARGEIQVSIQFTRNNLTASMFDLSIKDKPKTPFGKLKDKMKVKKLFDMESSSAIVPSNVGRLDSDDDEKKPKSKAAAFLKGRLRKSSLTKSNTSLGSDSTISSTSGTMPSTSGITIVLPEAGKKPAARNSSLSTEPSVKDHEASPRMTHKRAFSDEVSQLKLFPEPKSVQNLKPKSSPISKSSVCINGSHVYAEVPLPKPLASPLEKSVSASKSSQNITKKSEEAILPEGAGQQVVEKKLESKPAVSTSQATEQPNISARISAQKSKNEESKPVHVTTPMVFIEDTSKGKQQEGVGKDEKKPKFNQHDHVTGKNESSSKNLVEQSVTPHVSASTDEKAKADSWFSPRHTKDAPHKPSLDVSPQVETSSSASFTHCFPAFSVVSVVADTIGMPITNTNTASSSGVQGSLSANNPFLTSLQNNPFFEDLLSDQLLNTSSPAHFSSSFPSGSVATSEAAEWSSSLVEEHSPLTFSPTAEDQKEFLNQPGFPDRLDFPHASSSVSKDTFPSEWEMQFDEFASSRLQPDANASIPVDINDKRLYSIREIDTSHPCTSTQVPGSKSTVLSKSTSEAPTELNVEVLETTNLSNISDTEVTRKDVDSALNTDHSSTYNAPYIQFVSSVRIRSSTKDLTVPCGQNHDRLSTDVQTEAHKSEGRSALCHTDVHCTAQDATINISGNNYPDKKTLPHMSQNVYASDEILVMDCESNFDAITQITRAPITSENKIVAVSPIIWKGTGQSSGSECLFQETNATVEQVIESSVGNFANESQSLVRPEGGASREQVSNRFFHYDQETMPFTEVVDADGVKLQKDSLKATIGNVALKGPPKPPRLMLSTGIECNEVDDNCKQTSNQHNRLINTSEKYQENPKEMEHKQNIEVGKQTISPVTCCPVIEVSSIIQSTTEDFSTHLREENNDLKKLGIPNREHLLDVNETTMAEQFRTCLSKVSLDGLDLSSAEESRNKLDVLKSGPGSELISDGQSKILNLGSFKPEIEHNVLKPVPFTKEGKENEHEIHTTKFIIGVDNTHLPFLSALEEHLSIESHKVKPEDMSNTQTHITEQLGQQQSGLLGSKSDLTVRILKEEGQSGSMSQQSSWSADIIVDFKNEDFWKSESDILETTATKSLPSPGNPFTPIDKAPPLLLSHKNPFAKDSLSSPETLKLKDIPTEVALTDPLIFHPLQAMKTPFLHASQPLAFSTPFLVAETNPKLLKLPAAVMSTATSEVTTTTNTHMAVTSCRHSPAASGMKNSALPVLPQETQPDENPFVPLKTSPHPVKPINAAQSDSGPEKKSHKPALTAALNCGLEKLKSVTSGQNSIPKKQDLDHLKDACSPDLAAKYYHLTHDELINLLLQREAALGREEQHVRELEDYIDQLLVRIMDHAPTLLQVPLECRKNKM